MGTQPTTTPKRKVKAEKVEMEGTGRMGRGKGMPGLPPRGTGLKTGFQLGQGVSNG